MWSFSTAHIPGDNKQKWQHSRPVRNALLGAVIGLMPMAGCTVEPLNASRSVASGSETSNVGSVLASTEVAPVNTREAQQVRNALLFAMNGGQLQEGGRYKVNLAVESLSNLRSTQEVTESRTVGQIQIKAGYTMTDKISGAVITSGTRTALTSYDRTPQSFANQRAKRDAVNRAAKDVAQQIRLSLGQAVAGL